MSNNISTFLDGLAKNIFGKSREECFEKKICVKCGKDATFFKDELSKKEYPLSGFCQICQDNFFANHA